MRTRLKVTAICCATLAAAPVAAALAPNWQRLAELRRVLEHPGVNAALQDRIVDKVEYVRTDLYRVSSGRCHVDVAIVGLPVPRGMTGGRRFEVRPGKRVCT